MYNLTKNIILILIIFTFFISSKIYSKNNQSSIMIFAPASLKDSLEEVLQVYQVKNKIKTKEVYLGTAQLAQQIKNGAEPDLFISANIEWMEHLEKEV